MRDMDLAAIVLGDRDRRRVLAPEPMPIDTTMRGFDARSVLVLAVVVATIAGVVGWATMTGRQTGRPLASTTEATATATESAPATTVSADDALPFADAPAETTARPAVPDGVDLAVSRIVATRSGSGGAIVRLGIVNQGSDALDASRAPAVLVLLDGEVVGERTLGAIDATGSTTTELALDYCPSGRHALAVVIDPRGAVAEADERDNARTQAVAFGC